MRLIHTVIIWSGGRPSKVRWEATNVTIERWYNWWETSTDISRESTIFEHTLPRRCKVLISTTKDVLHKALTHLYSYRTIWHLLKFIGKPGPFSLYVRIFKRSSMQFFEAMQCIFYICDNLWKRYFIFNYPWHADNRRPSGKELWLCCA